MFSRELSKKLEGTGVATYSCEPGAVRTDLQRHIGTVQNPTFLDRVMNGLVKISKWSWKTPEQGAQTQIYCAVAPELDGVTGKYYASCAVTNEAADAKNDEYAKRLWEICEEYTLRKKESDSKDDPAPKNAPEDNEQQAE